MKQCARCGIEKILGVDFTYKSKSNKDGFSSWCNACHSENRMSRYASLSDEERTRNRNWKHLNRNKINDQVRNRMKNDILFRLRKNLSTRLSEFLKGKSRNSSIVDMIGCSLEELKYHIESQFLPEMTWENYGLGFGKWNIDHVYPLSLAKTQEELYKLNHHSNLRPMWSQDNLKKGNRVA